MGKKASYIERKSTILGAVEEALSVAEELRDELQEWYDNLPESLQSGTKADELQEAIDLLEEAISALEDAQNSSVQILLDYEITYLEKELSPSKQRHMTRAMRLEQGTLGLMNTPIEIPEDLEVPEDDTDDAQEALDRAQEGLDQLQSVTFPRMFG